MMNKWKNDLHLCVSLIVLLVSLSSVNHVSADVTQTWVDATEDVQLFAINSLKQSRIIDDFSALVDENLTLSETLKVGLVTEGEPVYHASNTQIQLPYAYYVTAIKAHVALDEERSVALDEALSTVEYTLYHMLGHILIDDSSPDADSDVEEISSWLMIKHWPNGGEQWLENSRAFGRASQLLDGPLSDYWHAHSLYKKRQHAINCWILGSDPARYESLLKVVLDPAARRAKCVKAWDALEQSVVASLEEKLLATAAVRH